MPPSICQLTPVFGAKITNIDLSQKLNRGIVDTLKEAFEEHSLLLFPKQHISDEAHVAFTEYFGVSERPRKSFGSYHHRPNINVVINYDKEEITTLTEIQGQILSKGTISIVGLPNEYK